MQRSVIITAAALLAAAPLFGGHATPGLAQAQPKAATPPPAGTPSPPISIGMALILETVKFFQFAVEI